MERLLEKYYPLTKEDIENCCKGSIEAFIRGDLSMEHMERLARFTATDRQIRHHGLATLPNLHNNNEIDDEESTRNLMLVETVPEVPEECIDIGINAHEYNVLKGNYGTVLGITVNKYVYKALMRKCKSKRALSMRQSEALAKRFVIKKMKTLVVSITKRRQKHEIIASIKTKVKPNILIKS